MMMMIMMMIIIIIIIIIIMSYRSLMQYIVTCKGSSTICRQFMKRCLLAVAEELCQDYAVVKSDPLCSKWGRIYLTYFNCVQGHFIIIYSQWMEVMTSETLCSRWCLLSHYSAKLIIYAAWKTLRLPNVCCWNKESTSFFGVWQQKLTNVTVYFGKNEYGCQTVTVGWSFKNIYPHELWLSSSALLYFYQEALCYKFLVVTVPTTARFNIFWKKVNQNLRFSRYLVVR
jgi:hypothetical protein